MEMIAEAKVDDQASLKEYVQESIPEFEEKTEISNDLYTDLISYVSKHSDCIDSETLTCCATELWVKCKLDEEDWDVLFKNK